MWVCEAPTARTASAVVRKYPGPGVAQAGLSGACVCFTAAATGRGVMSGVSKAAALAVYRQMAVLFTAAHTSRGASGTQPCGSPSRKAPAWKVTRDCGGPGRGGSAQSKVGEPMAGARGQQITPQGPRYLPGLGHCRWKCGSAQAGKVSRLESSGHCL